MALVLADRVKETTSSTGTTAITLAGAAMGYQTFSSAVGNANTTYYTIADQTGANWEVGIGTYTTSGNTLSRDTVLASSNAGSLVAFTAGVKDVFISYPAERALYAGGPLGTPTSGTLTNATGYTYANLSGTVPTWNQNTTGTAANVTGLVAVTNGGTGTTTPALVAGSNVTITGTWPNQTIAASSGGSATKTISNKTAAYTVVAGDLGTIINCTSGTFTVSLTAAATLGSGFTCTIWNSSTTATDAITIDPAGAETIDGVATLILRRGEGLAIISDGVNWQTDDKKPMRAYSENLGYTTIRSTASGTNAIAIGSNSTSSGSNSVAVGTAAQSSASYSFGAFGTASGNFSVAIANGASATSASSVAIGQNSAGNGSQAVTGAGATALGGSYASGTDSFAAAIGNNTSTYGAQATGNTAIGYRNKSSTSSYATSIGFTNTSSGLGSTAIGYNNSALGDGSVAIGFTGKASQYGKYVLGGWYFGTVGDSQYGQIIIRASTTTTTAVVLTSDGGAAGTTNQLILASGQAMAISGTLIAKQTASGNMAGWTITGIVSNNGGTMAVSGLALTAIGSDSITLGAQPTIAVDNTNKGVTITSGFKAATSIRWVANVQTSEVTYA